MTRRRNALSATCLLLLATILSVPSGEAQSPDAYPAKPITFVMPLEAGSSGDILARPLIQRASAILGQPIVIENRPGAASTIGYRTVMTARPDGYTIGMSHSSIVTAKIQGIFPYDHAAFTVIGAYVQNVPIIVASTKTPHKLSTLPDVVGFAKNHPGKLTVATSNVGGMWWIAAMGFQESTKASYNIIPQEGAGGFAIAQVAGGHTDLAVVGVPEARSHAEAGTIKMLAVFSDQRAPGKYADLPTLKELGWDVNIASVNAVLAPKGLPKPIVDRLVGAFGKAANDPEYQKFVIERTSVPMWLPGERAVRLYDDQRQLYGAILRNAGIVKGK
jgi:tripartite-type tricarboxylate transporter receptor subunit TctC